MLGHAWDHEVQDLKVVYRPLYHCPAKRERFEAHLLAVSHFARWEQRFTRVPTPSLPAAARALLLPGPFYLDPAWGAAERTRSVPEGEPTASGIACRRSHAPRS